MTRSYVTDAERAKAPQIPQMKRLAYERNAMISSRLCTRCGGTGAFKGPCWTCNSFGRLPTVRGKQLLAEVTALIGGRAPLDEKGRFDESVMFTLLGKDLKPGMRVHSVHHSRYRTVLSVEPVALGLKVTFDDNFIQSTSSHAAWYRELSESDVDRADVYIAGSIGDGAATAVDE